MSAYTPITTTHSIQDRTPEFRSILTQAQRRLQTSKQQKHDARPPTRKERSAFAHQAASIGRGISTTMSKLERLAQLAKRKTLFDDRPVEIAELTYVIKQDLSALNAQIGQLQQLSRTNMGKGPRQESEHNANVVVLLQGKLADVGANFKEVLEVRTKNIQASRSRTENFVSSVGAHAAPQASLLDPGRTDSPLYSAGGGGASRSRTPNAGNNADYVLSLDPV